MSIRLIWITPDADAVIGYCARVSNPANQSNADVSKLLAYCAKHGHWSIFEMASACIEIETTRDIGRQILRHRSFSFQEFSQRYAEADELGEAPARAARMQDRKNRQSSLDCDDPILSLNWQTAQAQVRRAALDTYRWAINRGIAKEVARSVLPEGLTMSRMYASGTMRSWITYLQQRLDASTQLEHREIAEQILALLREAAPVTMGAFYDT
jgi:thymidylate synthase (FAD)